MHQFIQQDNNPAKTIEKIDRFASPILVTKFFREIMQLKLLFKNKMFVQSPLSTKLSTIDLNRID